MNGRSSTAIVDACGALLLVAAVGAALVAAAQGGDARPTVVLFLATAGMVALGRFLGSMHRSLIPAAVAGTAVAYALTTRVLGGGPLGGPFGYRNATGAFYVQATVAALMVAAAIPWWPLRVAGLVAAVSFALVAATDSSAATASLLVAIAVASVALGGARLARLSVATAAALFVVVLAGTVALGAAYRPGAGGPLARALTERRLVLWNESLQIIADRPGGVGPGRFRYVDPTARRDQDARWAHNEFLQQGVEFGWAGLVLTLLLFLWGFARLWVHPAPDLLVALGAASLVALGIQASVDYVLRFPAVPLAAAALIATAQAVPSRRFRRDHDDARQEGNEGNAHPAGVAGPPPPG